MNEESKNTPVVMIHGYGAGSAFWAMNLEEISEEHPVYVFDTLGFARSSRPEFSDDPAEIELQFVESIEKWREAMGFEKMVLLGHSFGGYQASAYALKYPDRLEHLVLGKFLRMTWNFFKKFMLLVDPWGFDKAPELQNFPLWKLSIANILSYVVGPFVMVRFVKPFKVKAFRYEDRKHKRVKAQNV